ncbi:sugar transferase [Roseovarius spongiae]|uniref:Sugar transferase n=1 Tax=Roseovarius spongiae TaxID=2320272 RepID=A0A3A8AR09_9RHOB|nr:sugar transferase [Roseovarius spongiae]RKF12416.1 sugar transferase [Roseovarius spongiae]
MKRLFDLILGGIALCVFAPVIAIAAVLVWRQDRHWPFYTPWRVGRYGRRFRLFKLRSMIVGADLSRVDTTTNADPRITRLGHRIRRYKLDELPQFANVVLGQMSLVGPRPNIDREVNLYTTEERRMLEVRPGITDLSSIVFSDLGEILEHTEDANIAYNQLVRPWKSRLVLFYIDNRSFGMDLRILWLTAVAMLDSGRARAGVADLIAARGALADLVAIARRDAPLAPTPPPGSDRIVTSREIE